MSQEAVATPEFKKKEIRKQLSEKLTGVLSEYKEELGEKKLATHVKKVSKLISRDLLKVGKKNHQRKVKAGKTKKAVKVKASKDKSVKAKVVKAVAKTKE